MLKFILWDNQENKKDIFKETKHCYIDDKWRTVGVCKSCYSYIIDVSFNNLWFVRDETCPVCGEIGKYKLITVRKAGSFVEVKLGDVIHKIRDIEQLKRLLESKGRSD